MGKFIRIGIFLISFVFFVISGIWTYSLISAQNKLENDFAKQAAKPSDQLRILPPGTKILPTPKQSQTTDGFGQNKLSGNKLQSCQDLSKTFIDRSNNIFIQGLEINKTLMSLQRGAEQFYLIQAEKADVAQKTYPRLATNSKIQQQISLSLLESLQLDIENFSCDSDNPPAQVLQIDAEIKSAIGALTDYKLSVRNLILSLGTIPKATISAVNEKQI
jgi:hypothetical protein